MFVSCCGIFSFVFPFEEQYMPELVSGIVKRAQKGGFILCDPSKVFGLGPVMVIVPSKVAQSCSLVQGATVVANAEKGDRGGKIVKSIESVCGLSCEEFKKRKSYKNLTAITPDERFRLSDSGQDSMRIIDLIAPIGKGTRGLIIAPAKAGKTVMLEQIANAIVEIEPGTRVIVLLIDERPEEVTMFRRAVKAEVFASTIDQSTDQQIELAQLVLDNVLVDLECGKNVVVLIDSLTRMGRAFNRKGSGTGRTMSGGMEVGVLEIPRKFFGLARNVEGGGSVTIIATCLSHTGSRMDQLIFEEFKGTGNSEIVLDRQLAESRIFPAIDVGASGTRKEECLYTKDEVGKLNMLRKVLSGYHSKDQIDALKKLLYRFKTNQEFLQSFSIGV